MPGDGFFSSLMNQSESFSSKVHDRMMNDSNEQTGIIILGNSGVGKSFLANVLTGYEAFVHRFSPNSVTHKTESVQVQIDRSSYTVFNIPGLIEAEQERVDMNKVEIDRAFLERPNSMIIFVFGHQQGRIRDEDIVAFNTINAAYAFQPESLAIVINGLIPDRTDTYEGTTLVLLQHLWKDLAILDLNICFFDQVVKKCKPMIHIKRQEIETRLDQLKGAQKKIRNDQMTFEVERKTFLEEIAEKQDQIRETYQEQQDEKIFFQRAIEQQQENLAEQNRQVDQERELFRCQVLQMQKELDRAKREYQAHRQNPTTPQLIVHRTRSIFHELQEAFTKLIFIGFARLLNI